MLRRMLHTAASSLDRAVSAAVLARSKAARARSRAESLGHAERMEALEQIRALYDRPEHYASPSPLFPAPSPVAPRLERVRSMSSGAGPVAVVDATWASPFAPHAEGVTARYLGHAENRTAAARLFLHEGSRPRPAAILVHGYRCGQFALEERVWPVGWLLDRRVDVALAVLPFHGVRAKGRSALFPSSDPRMTNEGFLQATLDLRALAGILRAEGASDVGAMGMSLGGYATALLATVEPSLAFAVPMIPLASIADFARDAGRLVGTPDEQRLQHEALDAAHRVVSPFARPSLLGEGRALVLAADADRITPIAHARRVAQHLGAPLETFAGGHLLQIGRADAFRAVGRMLGRLGLFG